MTRKVTKANLECVLVELSRYFPGENLILEQWEQQFRIIRQDHSRPFGSDYHSKNALWDILWAVLAGLELAKVERE